MTGQEIIIKPLSGVATIAGRSKVRNSPRFNYINAFAMPEKNIPKKKRKNPAQQVEKKRGIKGECYNLASRRLYELRVTPTSNRSCTKRLCSSMKKSGWPTSSARPRAFSEEALPPVPMRLIKLLPPVRKLLPLRSAAVWASYTGWVGCV